MNLTTLVVCAEKAKVAEKLELHRRINQQVEYRRGWDARACSGPCDSANGAYLNGYYNQPDGPALYYVTERS